MGVMYRVCDCEYWKRNMTQIDGFIMFGFTHGYKYTGRPFVYCPWCGKQVKDAAPEKEEANDTLTDTESTVYTATM